VVGHETPGRRASTTRQSLDAQLDSLGEAGVTRVFSEHATSLRAGVSEQPPLRVL